MIQIAVSRWVREIGIRMALGAHAARVRVRVLGHTLMLAALGITVGTLGALWASKLLARFLYGVEPTDPPTYAAMALVLAITALLAGYLPARRASRIDPARALRNE